MFLLALGPCILSIFIYVSCVSTLKQCTYCGCLVIHSIYARMSVLKILQYKSSISPLIFVSHLLVTERGLSFPIMIIDFMFLFLYLLTLGFINFEALFLGAYYINLELMYLYCEVSLLFSSIASCFKVYLSNFNGTIAAFFGPICTWYIFFHVYTSVFLCPYVYSESS